MMLVNIVQCRQGSSQQRIVCFIWVEINEQATQMNLINRMFEQKRQDERVGTVNYVQKRTQS